MNLMLCDKCGNRNIMCFNCKSNECYRESNFSHDEYIKKQAIKGFAQNIVERLDLRRKEYEEASNHPSIELPQECYYKGIMRGYEYSRDIVKEEGGLNE